MKTMKKFFAFSILLFAFTVGAFAQASSPALATIITPIAISNDVVLDFGAVVASGALGTVTMAPDNTRTEGGGVTLHASNVGSAAEFSVTGQANFTYSITLPAGATTISDGGTNTMTVSTWTSNPTVLAGGQLDGTGNQTLRVGATLNVAANQAPGDYSSEFAGGSGPFTVTVNYN
jgi:hypothetical protein